MRFLRRRNRTGGHTATWTDGLTDGRMDGRTDGWMEGWIIAQMDGWMYERTDGCTHAYKKKSACHDLSVGVILILLRYANSICTL